MGYSIPIQNGILSLVYNEFNCPVCGTLHGEESYYNKLQKAKNFIVYISCKKCKEKLGVTFDIKGDVQVWLKSQENK